MEEHKALLRANASASIKEILEASNKADWKKVKDAAEFLVMVTKQILEEV